MRVRIKDYVHYVQVTPFGKTLSFAEISCPLRSGLNLAMNSASRFFRFAWKIGAEDITFQVKECPEFAFKCFAGSDFFLCFHALLSSDECIYLFHPRNVFHSYIAPHK